MERVLDPVTLTRRLVDIPSVTGEEHDVGLFLADYLDGLGWRVELQPVADRRNNLIAHLPDAPPRIVFSTHMDTVPPFIESREDDQRIYGRGACDAKGIIAAQATAAERLRAEGIRCLGLLWTVDEELGSLGAQKANRHPLASECRFMINGEPTDNKLALGTKGALHVRLTAVGRAAHSAYPEQGESAIEKLLDALADVRRINWPTDPLLGPTTCNIGVIQGGTRPNVVPDLARADLHIRLVTEADAVKRLIERAIAGRAAIEYVAASPVVRMTTVDGFDTCIVRFATDVPHLSNWGRPLLLGPGSILVAHTPHEQIAKNELHRAVALYMELARRLRPAD
ncbi:MAG: peptidase dimerization protein [Pyrinomonas sp.]|uniref:M20/M25/M40 family metallo-hydrolase n=1 Tax=Pyrinomonas sp. TaxID=2080306 RepID=UPI0033268126